jgi:sulfur-carrier protein
LTGGAAELQLEAADVAALIAALEDRHRGLRERLLGADGQLRAYVRIFVNDEDVRFLEGVGTSLRPGDTVAIVPAVGGGVCAGSYDSAAPGLLT